MIRGVFGENYPETTYFLSKIDQNHSFLGVKNTKNITRPCGSDSRLMKNEKIHESSPFF
jgi:hypothetical protein